MKRSVVYDGETYKVRSDTIPLPNFEQMDRMAVLVWLNLNTYARGYSTKQPNPLAGLGGAIALTVQS